MQFSVLRTCLLALASTTSVLAQTPGWNVIVKPAVGEVVAPGETYTIEWHASKPDAPISLILMQGKSNITLTLGETIATGIDSSNASFDWEVPADAGEFAVYGIKVELDSDPETFQYSNQFKIGASDDDTKPITTIRVSQVSTFTSTSTSSSIEVSTTSTTSTSSSSGAESDIETAPTTLTTVTPSTSTALVIVDPSTTEDSEPVEETSPITAVPEGAAGKVAVRGAVIVGALALALFA